MSRIPPEDYDLTRSSRLQNISEISAIVVAGLEPVISIGTCRWSYLVIPT
jgi:hypothetical protein